MNCIYCNAPTRSKASATCQVCFDNLSPTRREQIAAYEAAYVNGQPEGLGFMQGIVERGPYILLALILFWFFFLRDSRFFARTAPKEILSAMEQSSDPCFKKQRCLIVYVAPWCGACQAEVPFFAEVQNFTNSHPNVGFKVYVGSGEIESLKNFASQIKATTFIDGDGKVSKALGVHAYPSFYWLDKEGKIIDRPRRAYQLLPGITKAESYFREVLAEDKEIIFGS